ncbi:MFS transporter [Alistipes communis]|uniref:MFS transporter n=1 Tax=Alistipes communis TaxID=2585118 RepID=UPI0030786D8E
MPRRLWAILAVTFGVALSVLDGTIANVALPTIAHELGVSSADSIWVVNAYQLAIVVSLLSFSTLGDVVGYRRIYIGGLVFFTLSSVGCAFAGSLEMLIAMRVIQGFGGAAVVSINTSIIRIIYPRDQLGRGMGINATVVAIASVAGPTLAAAILSMASWHWLFAINIPIGIAAVWLSMRFLPYNPVRLSVRLSDRRFDWRDGVMNALTFGLLIASVEGFSHGLDPRIVACGVSAFCVVGYLFVRSQLRKPYPLLPFDLLRIPIFSLSVFTSICSFVAQMLALVALPFFLQKELGYSDVQTGLLLTAWPAVIVVVAPVAGLLVERVHAGVLGGVGLTVMAAGLLLLALLPDHPTDGAIIWRLVVCGAGFGLFQSPNNSILIASAPAYRSGSASGMLATARLIGQTTGAALMALFFHLFPSNSTHLALYVSAALALAGALASSTRISLALPESLRRAKEA